MKKRNKIILIVISVFILFGITDFILSTFNKAPLFAIRTAVYKDGGSTDYWGLGYKVIKCNTLSGDKLVHFGFYNLNVDKVCKHYPMSSAYSFIIVDETKACAEAIEKFYEDDLFTYYFGCIKSSTVIISFTDGSRYNIKEALENKKVSIKEIEDYLEDTNQEPIFYKTIKIEISVLGVNDNGEMKEITENRYPGIVGYDRKLYYYGIENIMLNSACTLGGALKKDWITMEELIDYLENGVLHGNWQKNSYDDGGSILYKTFEFSLLKCNTLAGNKDYYIGSIDMGYEEGFCK